MKKSFSNYFMYIHMPNSRMIILILVLSVMSLFCSSQPRDGEWTLESPDKNIRIIVSNKKVTTGNQTFRQLSYQVQHNGLAAVLDSRLGIDREDAVLSKNLKPVSQSAVRLIDEKYLLKSGKCHLVHNFAQERVLTFKNRQGKLLELVLHAYNDGVAFRYRFPEFSNQTHKVIRVLYQCPDGRDQGLDIDNHISQLVVCHRISRSGNRK